ncbi:SDR family oxidoreductase [Alkalihalobacillus sp. AL-G]|uniref:SDR family oxidoreductase n=1 Tax=Alkalihalobacillus sp. AL-G TaxID=2926399 RepID=UPI00272A8E9F|nr:SDR family oxidoreductase [Alkalihalobacillus sp. AL-G]WLD94139.1 SDR family oxidoreductase [Alkalihalobacillus sp. AL-G]
MLNQKVAIVTGGSRGAGKAIAGRLAAEGTKLAIIGSSEQIHESAKELTENGAEVLSIQADVSNEQQVKNAFKQAIDHYGQIDLLVNNAGLGFFKPTEETTLEEWQKVFAVNVQGVFLCTKEILPFMKEKKSGTIITISSDVGRRTIANGAAYTATKYAVQGFIGSVAQEVQEYGIRIGTINPGAIDTYFADSKQGETHKEDWLKVNDIAEAVCYMASAPKHMVVDEIMLHPLSQEYPRI